MQSFGFNLAYLLLEMLVLAIPILMAIGALIQIKSRSLTEIGLAIWVAIILVPFGGPVAFWIVQPGRGDVAERR